jgi:hypothetical protein
MQACAFFSGLLKEEDSAGREKGIRQVQQLLLACSREIVV